MVKYVKARVRTEYGTQQGWLEIPPLLTPENVWDRIAEVLHSFPDATVSVKLWTGERITCRLGDVSPYGAK